MRLQKNDVWKLTKQKRENLKDEYIIGKMRRMNDLEGR